MLEYNFKSYYNKEISISSIACISKINCYMSGEKLVDIVGFSSKNRFSRIKLFNLDCEIGYLYGNDNFHNIKSVLNHVDIKFAGYKHIDGRYINKIHQIITMSLFLDKMKTNKNLLNNDVNIVFDNGLLINKNEKKDGPPYSERCGISEISYDKYYNFLDLATIINALFYKLTKVHLYIKQDKTIDKYSEIVCLYLKCSLIALIQTYEYIYLIAEVKNKINCTKGSFLYCNSIKKLAMISIETNPNQYSIYSKRNCEENTYLYLVNKCFISSFNTYSNIETIDKTQTIVGKISSFYKDDIIKYKILISSEMLEYFSFLKSNRKNDLYTEDYAKLNKVLNAMKSIATIKSWPVEFIPFNNDIYSSTLVIDEGNFMEAIDDLKMDLIPKDISQALQIKEMFTELSNLIPKYNEFLDNHVIPINSSESPLDEVKEELLF